MATSEDYVPINVDILRDTLRAIHARCSDGVPRWIPRSVIFGPHEKQMSDKIGHLVQIRVFRWFVEKNGMKAARGAP